MQLRLITTTAILTLSLAGGLYAQDQKDPYVKGAAKAAIAKSGVNAKNQQASARYTSLFEVFSLPIGEASALLRSQKTHPEIYEILVKKANLEAVSATSGITAYKNTNESINEKIYPTEFKRPNIFLGGRPERSPNKNQTNKESKRASDLPATDGSKSLSGLAIPALPTDFETRNMGLTVELEVEVGPVVGEYSFRIAPEMVYYIGRDSWGEGSSKSEMPNILAQRITSTGTTVAGQPFFLGTMSRFQGLESDKDLPKRVWFAMLTITPIK